MKKLLKLTIPDDLTFATLELQRDPDGHVSFSIPTINRVCAESGIDPEILMSTEDNVAGLIVAWYNRHRELGGDPDQTADDLILETIAEDALGDGLSHRPGTA